MYVHIYTYTDTINVYTYIHIHTFGETYTAGSSHLYFLCTRPLTHPPTHTHTHTHTRTHSHALVAARIVDVRNLFPSDLMELAEAIALPLVDSTRPFPPAAVLGLMRIVVTVLGCEQAGDTVASFSRIGIKHARPITATLLTWEDAMRTLR